MDYSKFEKDTEAFSLNLLQDTLVVVKHLYRNNWTIKDLSKYIKRKQLEVDKKNELLNKKFLGLKMFLNNNKCPRCESMLILANISIPKGKANKFGYKTHISCSNENCLYEHLDKRDIDAIIRDFKRREKERRLSNG